MQEARLKAKYKTECVPALMEKFKYTSVMQVPHLEKVVINVGVGDATQNSKFLIAAKREQFVIHKS